MAARGTLDLKTPEGRIEYLKRAVNILADIRNPLSREVYAASVAKDAGISADGVNAQALTVMKKKRRQEEAREWRDIEMNREMVRDRINPEKAQNIRAATAEEGILAYILRHPDESGRILEAVADDDFVTTYDRRVLSAMRALNEEHADITLTMLSTLLSPDEASGVARILARSSETPVTAAMVEDYMKTLAEERQKMSRDAVGAADPSEIERYRQMLKSKK